MGGGITRAVLAVLRADVVGSTDFLANHGVHAAVDTRRQANAVVDEVCVAGRLLDRRGDGSLVGFTAVTEALVAARALQQRVTADGHLFELRVSVTVHEVDPEADLLSAVERHSEALESICPSGSVLVDGPAHRAVRGTDGFRFEPFTDHVGGEPAHRLIDAPVGATPNGDTGLSIETRAVLFSDLAPGIELGSDTPAETARAISERCIVAEGGTVADTNGAGSVGLFPSCGQALEAAQAMHQIAAATELRADISGPLGFRVGVSVGDVVDAGGSPFGLPVVEAARLLGLADSACTLSSADVTALSGGGARSSSSLRLGDFTLKGIPDPVPVDRWAGAGRVEGPIELPSALQALGSFPLTGRSGPFETLTRLWSDATGGAARGGLVTGEEGIGKTRLVQELAAAAHREGAIVLHGACQDDRRVPFAPIAQALSRAAPIDDRLAAALTGEGPGPLNRLLRTGADTTGSDAADAAGAADQFAMYDAVAGALVGLAVQRPVLLVIDDVQWVDADTVRMIERTVTAEASARIAVVATCRSENLTPEHPIQRLLQAGGVGRRFDRLSLDRLDRDDVATMLTNRDGPELGSGMSQTADLADKLVEITGGSPLYVEELIAHLTTGGLLLHDPELGWQLTVDLDELVVPDSVIDLMAQRARRLGPDAVAVLARAALIGGTFESDVLADIADHSIEVVLDIIEQARVARLLRETDVSGTFGFSDEIAREAVLREVRPAERPALHQRIAEALERLMPNQVDRLATHWSTATGPEARERAIHHLRTAGRRDMEAAAWQSSAERHQQVLDLLRIDGVEDDSILGEVRYGLGLSLRKVGDAAYRPELIAAADIARRSGQTDLLSRSAIAMMRPGAWYPEAVVVDDDIVDMCEDALLLLAPDDPIRPRVMAALAVNVTYRGDEAWRAELVAEAQELARATGDLRLIGVTLAAEIISFHQPSAFQRRRSLADEVRRIGRATGDRDLLFAGSWFVVLDLMGAGEFDKAQRLVDELRAVVEVTQEYWPCFLVAHYETALAIARCDENASDLIAAERSQFEHQPVDSFGVSVIQQAVVALGHGTLSDMLLAIVEAAGEHGNEVWSQKWNYAVSRAYLDAGDVDSALAAIAMNPDPDFDHYWLSSVYHKGLLGLLGGLPEICRSVVDNLAPYRGRFVTIGLGACVSGQVSTALGQARLGLGDLDEAEELLREAAAQADRAGFPYFATNARRFLAQTLLARDPDNAEAHSLIEQIIETSERNGFGLEQREARTLLESNVESST